jgi:putative transposase
MDRALVELRAGRQSQEIEELIVRMVKENRSWGYDRIVGALSNLGHQVSDQTVGNVLRRHGMPPAPERRRTTTWVEFVRAHLAVLVGTDFSRWRSSRRADS